MKTTRREFIGTTLAFAPFARLWAAEMEAPLLKIGVMTDTHVGKTKESCSRTRLAYEMFRDMGVDLIANVGDVADHHYPTRPIRTTCSSVRVRAARCASSA